MAFNPKNFKVAPVRLCLASWGPNNWVLHDYDGFKEPLVFRDDQRKVVNQNGAKMVYAYHIPGEGGGKHGVEYLTKEDGTKAKLWGVKDMTKALADMFCEVCGVDAPEIFEGVMTNFRNDCFAKFSEEFEFGIHIARLDNPAGEMEDLAPLWYSFKLRDQIENFPLEDKDMFISQVRSILTANKAFKETEIPSAFQYDRRLSYQDKDLYDVLRKYLDEGHCCPLDVFSRLTFAMGMKVPSARPCCVTEFAKECIRNAVESDTCVTFKSKMYQVFKNVGNCGPLYSAPTAEIAEVESLKCWNQTKNFLDEVWQWKTSGLL